MAHYDYWKQTSIKDMVGDIFDSVEVLDDKRELVFTLGRWQYVFAHDQDCCEDVQIVDIAGDLEDLVGVPLLMASEEVSTINPEGVEKENQESFTWTFYKFGTIKGYVTVRWYGESNGYYSESVDIYHRDREAQ